nr:heavy metal-associated isoprenylated plant protein 33-like [Arachis hypogaea]
MVAVASGAAEEGGGGGGCCSGPGASGRVMGVEGRERGGREGGRGWRMGGASGTGRWRWVVVAEGVVAVEGGGRRKKKKEGEGGRGGVAAGSGWSAGWRRYCLDRLSMASWTWLMSKVTGTGPPEACSSEACGTAHFFGAFVELKQVKHSSFVEE